MSPLLTKGPKPGTSYAYAYASDPEQGPPSPVRYARRLIARRARYILGVTLAAGFIVYITGSGPSWSGSRSSGLQVTRESAGTRAGKAKGAHADTAGETGALENIWDEQEEDEAEAGSGWGWGLPFKKPTPTIPDPNDPNTNQKVIGGGSGGSESDSGSGAHQQEYGDPSALDYIAPPHPDLSLLPAPSTLFSEVKLPEYLTAPDFTPFPDERLREIIAPIPPEADPAYANQYVVQKGSFSNTWEKPDEWIGKRGENRRVQWSGFAGGRDRWENDEQKRVREERREAVRRGFVYAWQAYKDNAWGHDEIRPVSKTASNPFNNWGASIIDTLDTLLLMGLSDEYNICRPHINQLNMHWVGGRDWSQGYTSEASPTDDEETPVETWSVQRDRMTGLAVFETGIRYLGGLLGAYDLSGDQLLVDRAVDLADILSKAFNTESGLPGGRIDPGATPPMYKLGQVSLAEVGSMSLEFIRLSQITGNRTWFDLAQRAMDYIEFRIIPRASATQRPLLPMWFQPDQGAQVPLNGGLTLGGLADSYYEYLIKTYKLLGMGPSAQSWRQIYEDSVDKIKEILYVNIDYIPDHEILAIGKYEGARLIPEIEHLTCFAGAMLGLGAKLLDRPKDMEDAEKFTQSCYWLSAATHTGLQPEVVEFFTPEEIDNGVMWEEVDQNEKPRYGSPDGSNTHKDRNGVLRWNIDGEEVYPKNGGAAAKAEGEKIYTRRLKGNPPGSKKVVGRGINRPETIESIFYMYRLTGDRKWQEKGWKMFVSWVTTAKVPGGISSIEDVTKKQVRFGDNMESFMFAETLKYHFLLQSEPDVLSLDDYVLNTEAHPFLTNPEIQSGSQRLWHPPPDASAGLGVRGQGTDAQKWTRLNILHGHRTTAPIVPGGGKGMGGGGGDPNYRPKPPGWA